MSFLNVFPDGLDNMQVLSGKTWIACDLDAETAEAGFVSPALGRALDLLPLADAILERFERHHFSLMDGDGAKVSGALREYDCLAGRQISARWKSEVITGLAKGWTDDGRLAIIDSEGQEIALDAGEVTLS